MIFITDTEELKDKELYEKALGLIDADRRERVLKVRHEGSGWQMVAAGVLLQYTVGEYVKGGRNACGRISDGIIKQVGLSDIIGELLTGGGIVREARRESGQPYLPDYPDVFVSISHSGARAMCGIADVPIGVDIQEHSERREVMDIAKRFFHEEEAAYLESISKPEHRRTEFYRLWCLHEAYVKNTGNGLSEGFKDVTFLDVLKTGKVCDNKYKCIIGGLTGYSAAAVMG